MGFPRKNKMKNKNRKTKKILVFDDKARTDYLTGFRKRKNERRKKAAEERIEKLKEEKKEFKKKRKELLLKSQNYTGRKAQKLPDIDDMEHTESVVHDLPSHTVTITDISEVDLAGHSGLLLGHNVISQESDQNSDEDQDDKIQDKTSQDSLKKSLKKLKRKQTENAAHPRKKAKKQNFSHSQDIKFKKKKRSQMKETRRLKRKH